jgi:hypothetical protein
MREFKPGDIVRRKTNPSTRKILDSVGFWSQKCREWNKNPYKHYVVDYTDKCNIYLKGDWNYIGFSTDSFELTPLNGSNLDDYL